MSGNGLPASAGNHALQRAEFDAVTNLFTKDFNDALEAIMNDPFEPIATRVRAWYKRKAWGNYSLYCVKPDGSPAFQSDCAADLGIAKQRVNDVMKYDEARGYLRLVGAAKVLYPVVSPELADPKDGSDEKSGTYRTFLQLWQAAHPVEFAELEQAEATRRRIRNQILCDLRLYKEKSGTYRTQEPDEPSGDARTNGPDVSDFRSGDARTKSGASLQTSSDLQKKKTAAAAAAYSSGVVETCEAEEEPPPPPSPLPSQSPEPAPEPAPPVLALAVKTRRHEVDEVLGCATKFAASIDRKGAEQILDECRKHAPDAPVEAIKYFIHQKGPEARFARKPSGFLIRAIPEFFRDGDWQALMRIGGPPPPEDAGERRERQRSQEMSAHLSRIRAERAAKAGAS